MSEIEVEMTRVKRALSFPRTNPFLAIAATLAVIHFMIFILYMTGRNASPLPYKTPSLESFVNGPAVPVCNFIAAILLAVAIWWKNYTRSLRSFSSLLSMAVMGGNTAILLLAAQDHQPNGSFWGFVLSTGSFLFSLILLDSWGLEEDDKDT